MNTPISRRKFARQSSAGLCGLLAGPALLETSSLGREPDPAEKRLILLGLNALARAHTMNYFADGHRGASLVSAHLLCQENQHWQERGDHALGIGHVFKYPYSYYDLLRRVDNPLLKKEWDAKAYELF